MAPTNLPAFAGMFPNQEYSWLPLDACILANEQYASNGWGRGEGEPGRDSQRCSSLDVVYHLRACPLFPPSCKEGKDCLLFVSICLVPSGGVLQVKQGAPKDLKTRRKTTL